nr:hypothetical protein Iba_scaffold65623CG0010 [Ipomoea batatas]
MSTTVDDLRQPPSSRSHSRSSEASSLPISSELHEPKTEAVDELSSACRKTEKAGGTGDLPGRCLTRRPVKELNRACHYHRRNSIVVVVGELAAVLRKCERKPELLWLLNIGWLSLAVHAAAAASLLREESDAGRKTHRFNSASRHGPRSEREE